MQYCNPRSENYNIVFEGQWVIIYHSTTGIELADFRVADFESVSELHLMQLAGEHEKLMNLDKVQALFNDLHIEGLIEVCDSYSGNEARTRGADERMKERTKNVLQSGFWRTVNSMSVEIPKEFPKNPELILLALARLKGREDWHLFGLAFEIVSILISVYGEIALWIVEKLWRDKVAPCLSVIMMYSTGR